LNNKLVDANGKLAQINGQISNDQGHKARAEGVLKALLAKKPCPPPAITDSGPVNPPPAIVVNRTFDPPAIVVSQPVEPSTWWNLVDRIRFNDDGTETWRWKDGHETVRTRTGVTSDQSKDKIASVLPTDRAKIAPPVTHTALSETTTDRTKVAPPVTHTALSETTPRTLGTATTHARIDLASDAGCRACDDAGRPFQLLQPGPHQRDAHHARQHAANALDGWRHGRWHGPRRRHGNGDVANGRARQAALGLASTT